MSYAANGANLGAGETSDRMCEELNVELARVAGTECLNVDFTDEYRRGIYENPPHLNAPGWLYGAEGAISRSAFEFLDDNLDAQDESHLGRSVTDRFAGVDPTESRGSSAICEACRTRLALIR